jgi:hypothetical protein
MMFVRRLDHDPTAHDVLIELIQLLGLGAYVSVDGFRLLYVPPGNL